MGDLYIDDDTDMCDGEISEILDKIIEQDDKEFFKWAEEKSKKRKLKIEEEKKKEQE